MSEVTVSKDVPGFVSNALLNTILERGLAFAAFNASRIILRESSKIMHCEKGLATRDDIDKTLRLGMGHPIDIGPLTLGEFSYPLRKL